MKVFVRTGTIYCSQRCSLEDGGLLGTPVTFPARPKDRVLDILLGRACCDNCGDNLEDRNAQPNQTEGN